MLEVQQTLDRLISQNAAAKLELTVARRTSDTLGDYILRLGSQMEQGSTVDEDMLLLEEIRNVSALLGDMFRDAVSTEIRAANRAGEQLRLILLITVAFEVALVAYALLFTRSARRAPPARSRSHCPSCRPSPGKSPTDSWRSARLNQTWTNCANSAPASTRWPAGFPV